MTPEHKALVETLERDLQATAASNAALAEFERTNVVIPHCQFRHLDADAVGRWLSYVAAVKAGNQTIEAW